MNFYGAIGTSRTDVFGTMQTCRPVPRMPAIGGEKDTARETDGQQRRMGVNYCASQKGRDCLHIRQCSV
jgi:hypothetical protein